MLVETLRKLLLVSLSIFFNPGSPLQLVYALFVSAVAWVEFSSTKPFLIDRDAYVLQVRVAVVVGVAV